MAVVREHQRKRRNRSEVVYVVSVHGRLPTDLSDKISTLHAYALLKAAPNDCALGTKTDNDDNEVTVKKSSAANTNDNQGLIGGGKK